MATIPPATPGDCQRGGAEVGEGSDGGGKDHGKQPLRSSAKASLHDEDDGKGWVRLTDLMNFRKVTLRFSRQNCDKSAHVHMTRFENEVRIYCQSRKNLKVVKWG